MYGTVYNTPAKVQVSMGTVYNTPAKVQVSMGTVYNTPAKVQVTMGTVTPAKVQVSTGIYGNFFVKLLCMHCKPQLRVCDLLTKQKVLLSKL